MTQFIRKKTSQYINYTIFFTDDEETKTKKVSNYDNADSRDQSLEQEGGAFPKLLAQFFKRKSTV